MSRFVRSAAALVLAPVGLLAVAEGAAPAHRVQIAGEGPVTVVFEAGLGDTLDVWKRVQSDIAKRCTRTFAYNRAGYAGSDGTNAPRDAEHVVAELRDELRARSIEPPYLLVGHSLGGLYMQYYALNYPDEVSGLVLVDATHWDQLQRIRSAAPTSYATLRAASMIWIGAMRAEFADSESAGAQVKASSEARGVPTIVLSSSRAGLGETPAFRFLMRQLQDEIADRFEAVRHGFPLASGHYIQKDRPQDVIGAIRELAHCGQPPPA